MFYSQQALTRSLYLHWPFCPYRCHFCPFIALASHDNYMLRYHRALMKEIKNFSKECSWPVLETIFIGGGTPSTYPDDLISELFALLHSSFIIDDQTEVTIEVNPGTVRYEQLPLWRSLGINRVSIGVQSLNDTVLKNLNRHQSANDVYTLLENASKHFDNISIDIIAGLPGIAEAEWKKLITTVVSWPITHMSLYILMVHEHTQLYFRVQKNDLMLPCDDLVVDMYYWARELFEKHGFMQYEISSFARPGYQCRHNTVYWSRRPYKGFGLGACSFDGDARFQNEKNLINYMEGVEHETSLTSFAEQLTRRQIHIETVMLGIRQLKGLSSASVIENLTDDEVVVFKKNVASLSGVGFLVEKDGNIRLTPKGLSVENAIAVKLALE